MTREEKRRNKEHCKGMSLKTKLQCWYFRNEEEIKVITLSAITSVITHLAIMIVLIVIALFSGMDF